MNPFYLRGSGSRSNHTAEFRNWTISQKEEQLSKYKGDVFITNNISSRENLSHCIFTVVNFPVRGNE